MSGAVWLTVGTTIGIVSPLIFWRYRQNAQSKHAVKPLSQDESKYQSIEIRPCLMACDAVAELRGQRFIASEAPELPLTECDQKECACRYQYHDDRRHGEDRRDQLGRFAGLHPTPADEERRLKAERRQSRKRSEPRSYFNDHDSG
jgi:hypothetical protein